MGRRVAAPLSLLLNISSASSSPAKIAQETKNQARTAQAAPFAKTCWATWVNGLTSYACFGASRSTVMANAVDPAVLGQQKENAHVPTAWRYSHSKTAIPKKAQMKSQNTN